MVRELGSSRWLCPYPSLTERSEEVSARPGTLTPGGDPVRPRPPLGLATPRMDVVAPTDWARLFPLFCERGSAWLDSPCGLKAPGP